MSVNHSYVMYYERIRTHQFLSWHASNGFFGTKMSYFVAKTAAYNCVLLLSKPNLIIVPIRDARSSWPTHTLAGIYGEHDDLVRYSWLGPGRFVNARQRDRVLDSGPRLHQI